MNTPDLPYCWSVASWGDGAGDTWPGPQLGPEAVCWSMTQHMLIGGGHEFRASRAAVLCSNYTSRALMSLIKVFPQSLGEKEMEIYFYLHKITPE